jgi:hypothetical protein
VHFYRLGVIGCPPLVNCNDGILITGFGTNKTDNAAGRIENQLAVEEAQDKEQVVDGEIPEDDTGADQE